MESYDKIRKVLALGFMNFLDENKPKDKMCLSNGECADIEKAFNEKDWPKLARYLDKYTESEDERMISSSAWKMDLDMTREEAIKKVRVALERLKSNFGKTAWWTGTGEAFEMLIPELKESEDERIRKAIVHLLEVASEAYLIEATGFKKEQFLSYLEKQKVLTEHKEGIYYYHQDGTFTFISHPAVENPHNFTAPRSNEKPVDYDHEMWKNCEANFEGGKKEVIDHPEKSEKQKEQKPALSEVELLFRGEKVTVKRPFYRDDKGRGYSTAELDEDVAWNALRAWCEKKGISLYDLYPKAEWSEEDEKIRLACIATINDVIDYERYRWEDYNPGKPYRPITKYDEQIDWLKSIRPSWKPSEEQMKELKDASAVMKCDSDDNAFPSLKTLYEQLEKL